VRLIAGLLPSILLLLASGGCRETSDCKQACSRVSRCRQQARVGEKMLGEKDLPPDARCMQRCQEQREEWEKCELVKKSCDALRGCYGPLR
jgi:hypothetical protein